jgi:adenosine/AMP kinase
MAESITEELRLIVIPVEQPSDTNCIIGQAHFIKTIEDLSEVMACSVPGARFGLAFCEASGDCLVRLDGNDPELIRIAGENALAIGAGHSFILFIRECYPINVLNAIKNVQEVCTVFCASSNRIEVIVAESSLGRGIMGVIDGEKPRGIEGPEGIAWRIKLLRDFGYKRR